MCIFILNADMDIENQIKIKSNSILSILDNNKFFVNNDFCPKSRLHIELQLKMMEKWKEGKDYRLTSEELLDIIEFIKFEMISDTIYNFIDKGVLGMNVGQDGKLNYSLTSLGELILKGINIEEDDNC